MEPRNVKDNHTPWSRKLSGLVLAVAALGVALATATADGPTAPRWHVAVSTAPQNPQDVWFAGTGSNTDGWSSGGSICLNQLAQGIPNGEQTTFLLDIVEGGIFGEDGVPVDPGTYTFPGVELPGVDYDVTVGTTFYVIVDAYVVQSKLPMFPEGETFTLMYMWDYVPGRADRNVVLWLYVDVVGFVPFLNEGTMMTNVQLSP
jgi:hypothetical protein